MRVSTFKIMKMIWLFCFTISILGCWLLMTYLSEDIVDIPPDKVFHLTKGSKYRRSDVVARHRLRQQQANDNMEEYFNTKYCTSHNTHTLMNPNLSIVESGALFLRGVAETEKSSLDFKYLEQRRLEIRKPALKSKADVSISNSTDLKHILYWNKFGMGSNFRFGAGPEAFSRCPVSACTATENRAQVPGDRVDALLYAIGPNTKNNAGGLPPFSSYPNARRVALVREAPDRLRRPLDMYNGKFDYTSSYRYDSDAPYPINYIVVPKTGVNKTVLPTVNFAKNKIKMAAWFVSNCDDIPSHRDRLAFLLVKHGVAVDIYGKCGPFECSKNRRDECYEMLNTEYKFYLSFENSLCNHYVTEKFLKILKYNIVPVTYGLGHELTGAPKDSYIDAFDFPDVAALAQYLLYLNSNDTAYNEYFRWKDHYEVVSPIHFMCQVCAILNSPHLKPPRRINNLSDWFSKGQCIVVEKNRRLWNFLSNY